MSSVADWVSGGTLPFRHEREESEGDLALRIIVMGGKIGGPDKNFGRGRDEFGRLDVEMRETGGEADSLGDLVSMGLWPAIRGKRDIPGWSNAWPSVITDPGDVAATPPGGGSTVSTAALGVGPPAAEAKPARGRPIFDRTFRSDDRFEEKALALPKGIKALPKGFPGITIAGAKESKQEDLFFPSGGVLVAPHWSGSAELGTPVFDLEPENELSEDRKAPLQTLTRVHRLPAGGLYGIPDRRALALQIGIARDPEKPDKTTRGAVLADELKEKKDPEKKLFDQRLRTVEFQQTQWSKVQVFGSLSKNLDGPVRLGCNKHFHGLNKDFERYSAAELHTNVFFHDSDFACGPIDFTGIYPDAKPPAGVEVEVYISYDDRAKHPSITGEKPGRWRPWTRQPNYLVKTGNQTETGIGTPPPPTETGGETGSIVTVTGGIPTGDIPTGTPTGVTIPTGTPTGGTIPTGTPTAPTEGGGDQTTEKVPEQVLFDLQGYLYGGKTGQPGARTNPPGLEDKYLINGLPVPKGALRGPFIPPPRPVGGAFEETSRARLATNLAYIASVQEQAFPAILFRPTHFSKTIPDLRNAIAPSRVAVDIIDRFTPIIARLEAVGAEADGRSWTYTARPGTTRYGSGTATGTTWFIPGELGLEQVFDSKIPSTLSFPRFGFYNSGIGFGTPLQTGLVASGIEILMSGGNLVFRETTAAGAASTTALEIKPATNTVEAYGVAVGAGGGDCCVPGLYGDGHGT